MHLNCQGIQGIQGLNTVNPYKYFFFLKIGEKTRLEGGYPGYPVFGKILLLIISNLTDRFVKHFRETSWQKLVYPGSK